MLILNFSILDHVHDDDHKDVPDNNHDLKLNPIKRE